MMHSKRKRLAEINVVPYIDVMLVLLIIFMVTAPMMTQGVKVSLPKAKAENISSKGDLPLVVTVNKDGQYFISSDHDGRLQLNLDKLAIRVKAQVQLNKERGKSARVLVKGDKQVTYDKVIYLMATLKQVGVEDLGLLTQSPKSVKKI